MKNECTVQSFVDKLTSVAAVITTHDPAEPIILAANKAHEPLSGYKNIDIVGKSPRIFQNYIIPTKAEKDELRNALATGDFWEGNLTNYKPNGAAYTAHIIIMGVVVGGNRYYL